MKTGLLILEGQLYFNFHLPLQLSWGVYDGVRDNGRSQGGFNLNSDWLISIWARTRAAVLARAQILNGPIQSCGWNHLANGRCRGPHHKPLRKAEGANFEANFSFFTILSTAEAQGVWNEIYWASWNCWFYCDSGLFPLRRKRFVEWLLTSDGWSGLPFHSFRRRSNDFK